MRQVDLLSINRTSLYRNTPTDKAISKEDFRIMHEIDTLHTAHLTWGYRYYLHQSTRKWRY